MHHRRYLPDLQHSAPKIGLQCPCRHLQIENGKRLHLHSRLRLRQNLSHLCGQLHQSNDPSEILLASQCKHHHSPPLIEDSLYHLHPMLQKQDLAGTTHRRASSRHPHLRLRAAQGRIHSALLLRCRPLAYRQHRKQIVLHRQVHALPALYVRLRMLLADQPGTSGERLASVTPSYQPSVTRQEMRRSRPAACSQPHHSHLISKIR